MIKTDTHNSHPSLAELDLVRTNQASADTWSHLSTCTSCQQTLEKLSLISSHLEVPEYEATFSESHEREMLNFIASHAKTIQESTTEDDTHKVTKLLLNRHPIWLKVAACFIVTTLLFFLNHDETPSHNHDAKSKAFHPDVSYKEKDLNRDGQLDIADVYILAMKLNEGADVGISFDLNDDQKVDQQDLELTIMGVVKVEKCMEKPTALTTDSRFATCDVYVDANEFKLGAWQLELIYDPNEVAILSVEGGEAEPFPANRPPFYNQEGRKGGRIILANVVTAQQKAKSGKFRIARLHLLEKGSENFSFKLGKTVNVDANGNKFKARINLIRK